MVKSYRKSKRNVRRKKTKTRRRNTRSRRVRGGDWPTDFDSLYVEIHGDGVVAGKGTDHPDIVSKMNAMS